VRARLERAGVGVERRQLRALDATLDGRDIALLDAEQLPSKEMRRTLPERPHSGLDQGTGRAPERPRRSGRRGLPVRARNPGHRTLE
jgi:hypothetical protein